MTVDTTRDVTTIEQVMAYHGCNTVTELRDMVRAIREARRRDATLCRYCETKKPPGATRNTCSGRCRTALSRAGGAELAW